MMESKHNEHKDLKTSQQQSAVDDSEEEENEILEESPCGRWHKRREEVEQNNIPGIDATYLAMDTEEGVEVVWNEVRFSERKFFKAKEETISEVFDRLIQLEHPNIVKLHKYWIHKDTDVPKVVFITEYMSSGSLRQYFEKTKRHDIKISLQVWRRWCTQTLSALCYLHSSQPSIVHGNINCDTIFISYNGLIKIGAIAPDAIHRHVKTVRSDAKSNLHFIAPELGNFQEFPMLSPSVDIYSFGMCALEMAALEIPSDNDQPHHITDEIINKTIESLDNSIQRDFIQQCLRKDSIKRPTARDLLFHPIIFEVPTLRLFCAHSILNNPSLQPEQLTEEAISRFLCLQNQNDRIVAEIRRSEQQPSILFKQSDFPNRELEKLLDEVKNGAYPLTAVMPTTRPPLVCRQRTISPEIIDEAHKQINTPDNPYDEETRRIVYMNCSVQLMASDPTCYDIKIVIKLDDKINRQLTCEILKDQLIPPTISQELVYYGFINKDDKENVAQILFEALTELNVSNNNNNNYMAFCEKSLQTQNKNNHINNNSTGLTTTTTTSSTITPAQIIVIQQQPNDLVCHHHHHHQQQQQYHQQQQNLISPDKNNEKTCDFLPDRFIIVETTNDNHPHHQMMMISPSNDNHSI
uniref:Nuclear receptor-binding protein-like n=1 Tax=Dermatophagoides pteronyssinus TaxID=6956 RepID=A0A6P6Y6Q9_DERPT|nr:nuclear receptor-binding protein-like [Dermatophagoides pteronyssinus]